MVIQIIKYPTPDQVRFDIFDRVNRGGTPLNNQVNYWLDYILGFQIQVKPISEVDQVIAMYSNAKSNRYYRASNVGFYASAGYRL